MTADRECFKGKAVLNLMHTLVDSDLGSSRNLRVREATSAAPFSAEVEVQRAEKAPAVGEKCSSSLLLQTIQKGLKFLPL